MNVSISQAMACGLPIIATRHSGFPDQVAEGVNGLLVPEGNWQALARAIIELMDHPEQWGVMGTAGRERVYVKYDNERIIDEQIRIYDHLLVK